MENQITIFVVDVLGQKTTVLVNPSFSVAAVKKGLIDHFSTNIENLDLLFDGKCLENGKKLMECGLVDGSEIHVFVKREPTHPNNSEDSSTNETFEGKLSVNRMKWDSKDSSEDEELESDEVVVVMIYSELHDDGVEIEMLASNNISELSQKYIDVLKSFVPPIIIQNVVFVEDGVHIESDQSISGDRILFALTN